MIPITIKIYNDILDSYYYMGRLFLITADGKFKYITQGKLFNKYLSTSNKPQDKLLKSILFNNKALLTQFAFNRDLAYQKHFDRFWNKQSRKPIEIKIDEKDLITLDIAPEKEPLDFIMYGKRALIANRDGLFECRLSIEKGKTRLAKSFTRIFDSKSISLNPRLGEVLISTKLDGLFRGSLHRLNENIKVYDKAIKSKSTRTGWVRYDFINYESSKESKLFINETQIDNDSKLVALFKEDDGRSDNIRISNFASNEVDISNSLHRSEDVIFAFNSLNFCFYITRDGGIFLYDIQNSRDLTKPVKMRTSLETRTLGNPLSAHPLMGGVVYEFFNKVLMIKNDKEIQISTVESKQVKTFSSSMRYQNIISLLTEGHLEVHSVYPYSV